MNKRLIPIVMLMLVLSISSSLVMAQQNDGEVLIISLLNQDPDPALTGEIVEIRLGIQNVGNEPTKPQTIEVLLDYPFELVPGEKTSLDLGTISPSEAGENIRIVKFKVRIASKANEGSFNLPVLFYETGKRDTEEQRLFNIDVKSK